MLKYIVVIVFSILQKKYYWIVRNIFYQYKNTILLSQKKSI